MAVMRNNHPLIRRPAVAGYYYPAEPAALRQAIDAVTATSAPPGLARATVVPHGSYRHAGRVAGAAWSRVAIPRRCIILGPSHTESWMPWSLMERGAYRTPLGDVPIDEACADALRARAPFLEPDAWTQRGEHAIEVIVPFLQQLGPPDLAIAPIVMGATADPDEIAALATAIAQVVRMHEERVLLVASSDLSHYEPLTVGMRQDRELIAAISRLDGRALIDRVREEGIRMCGAHAVACVLEAARALGSSEASLAAYGTSAEAGGDPSSVIGYAGLIIE